VSNINNETKTGETYIWILLDFFAFVVAAFGGFVAVDDTVFFVAGLVGTVIFVVAAVDVIFDVTTIVVLVAFDFAAVVAIVVAFFEVASGFVGAAASANTHIVTTNANFHKQFILTYNT